MMALIDVCVEGQLDPRKSHSDSWSTGPSDPNPARPSIEDINPYEGHRRVLVTVRRVCSLSFSDCCQFVHTDSVIRIPLQSWKGCNSAR